MLGTRAIIIGVIRILKIWTDGSLTNLKLPTI